MNSRQNELDYIKLLFYILKRVWIVVLCAELGFGAFYYYTTRIVSETFTASGKMYVNNGSSDNKYSESQELNTQKQLQLINTYLVVVRSEKVMKAVVGRLSEDYPGIDVETVSPTLSMASVSQTGVVSVSSQTQDAQLSADIVNAVMEYAPDEIIRVVNTGRVEIIDYAKAPILPDDREEIRAGLKGAVIGALIGACLLIVLYMFDQRVKDEKELTDNYTLPILASLRRSNERKSEADSFLLTAQSPLETIENYSKLRMNLLYTLVGKESHSVIITSTVSGEGKTTIAANLAISCAMGGKKILLIDGDLRRACQQDVFRIDKHAYGLSDILVGKCEWQEAVIKDVRETMDLLPAGHFPPNPTELLGLSKMSMLLKELEKEYDLVLIDMPPINVVADPLVLSNNVAGCLFLVRQNFSDHREIRDALTQAEMTGMNVLGFVYYGENIRQGGYYRRNYYRSYYNKYDYRKRPEGARVEAAVTDPEKKTDNSYVNMAKEKDDSVMRGGDRSVAESQPTDRKAKSSYIK